MNNWHCFSSWFLTDALDVDLILSILMHVCYRMLPENASYLFKFMELFEFEQNDSETCLSVEPSVS